MLAAGGAVLLVAEGSCDLQTLVVLIVLNGAVAILAGGASSDEGHRPR